MAAARAFANYIEKHKIRLSSVNIYTLDEHSRRTNLAYSKVLKSNVEVGSIVNSCPECLFGSKKSMYEIYYHSLDEFISWFITFLS